MEWEGGAVEEINNLLLVDFSKLGDAHVLNVCVTVVFIFGKAFVHHLYNPVTNDGNIVH